MKDTAEIWIMRFNAWNQARAHLLTLQATIRPLPANERQFLRNEISTFMRRMDDVLLDGRIPDADSGPTFSCNPGPECIGDSGERR